MQLRCAAGLLLPLCACRPEVTAPPSTPPAQTIPTASSIGTEASAEAQEETDKAWICEHFVKHEAQVPMRDGTSLFTTVYRPRESTGPMPILYKRTPYSVAPYGEDDYPSKLGPSRTLMERGYIFVYQDVRGCFMSEGTFVNMRPHIANKTGKQFDESSDTYDTIDWLVANVEGNNGRVGMWGVSYPGFYAAAGMIDAHTALKAVSPQAPIADWYFDDFHHHGAFFLPHAFNFFTVFGRPRTGPKKKWGERFKHGTPDGYAFFLELGALGNANERYLHHEVPFWDELTQHPNYDEFWAERNLLPHLKNVAPAVMTVGGWFDAEDLYGPLHIYRSIEDKNPKVSNMLVMGPWQHGGWARTAGDHLGDIEFGGEQSKFYQEEIEAKFFAHHLESKASQPLGLPEAYVFETGANHWRSFDSWPPEGSPRTLWFGSEHTLKDAAPDGGRAFDEFVSDPAHPVPFTEAVDKGMTREYMTDDQRFAARRPDVLYWVGEPLEATVTLAGPLTADLWVSTSQADADWVVKLIDVFPGDADDHEFLAPNKHMGGYQMMVRSEIIRGRYRDGYTEPKPFVSGKPTQVRLPLQDVLHTFKRGHRIMIQVQSSWFPMVDRNPQKWVSNIFEAKDEDFTSATHRVYRDRQHASRIEVNVIPSP